MTRGLGGVVIDCASGHHKINIFEVRRIKLEDDEEDTDLPEIASNSPMFLQHLSWLKDEFRIMMPEIPDGLYAFDAWAANFGETVSAMELAPEGTGYRMKTRFARFNNLPELISMWKLAADVQTADMLKLEVPELEGGKPTVIMCPPTELQKHTIQALGERAEAVRAGSVDPHMDNMLKIVRC